MTDGREKGAIYRHKEIADANENELLGLCKGIIADGLVNEKEVEFLDNWLRTSRGISENKLVAQLRRKVEEIMSDNVIDKEELKDIYDTLYAFSPLGEEGELPKSTLLPLTKPEPVISFFGHSFCFTGTFTFGTRGDCHKETEKRSGVHQKNITKSLNYLVIGEYSTESWKHSSCGTKILKALDYNEKENCDISIVSEEYWSQSLEKTDTENEE